MSRERIRVLNLITRLNAGGPARHVVSLTRGLSEMGYEALLVSGEVTSGEDDLSNLAAEEGVVLRRIPGLSREVNPLADASAMVGLWRILGEFEPRIVHTHTAKAGLVGRLATRLWNVGRREAERARIVHTYHGNVLSGYFPPLVERAYRSLERRLARAATDAVVVLSPEQRSEIVDRFRIAPADKVYVMPLALDLSLFERLPDGRAFRREMGFEEDAFVVGIVGRIAPIKNHEMFLRVAARVHRIVPECRFVVIGDGEGAGRLRGLARALDLGDAIRFAGLRTDLPCVYAGLDAVVLTSRNEGTPLSLIEAMASARPVAATDVGGVADILTREWHGAIADRRFIESAEPRGLLVAPEDDASFERVLADLARDPVRCRRLGTAGQAYAFRCHGLPRLLRDADDLYRRLLARCPRGAVPAHVLEEGRAHRPS